MSTDTPTPARVTLTDEERADFRDAASIGRVNAIECVERILTSRLADREQALREEIGKPHAYGVEVLVNAGRPSAYWQLEDDEGPRDTEEGAEDVRDMMLAEGHRLDHLRIVALTVVRGGAR